MSRKSTAWGIGLLVTALYIGVLGVLASTVSRFKEDTAFGYGVALLAAATAGAWLVLPPGQRGDGPR